jgi:hypothetical protein
MRLIKHKLARIKDQPKLAHPVKQLLKMAASCLLIRRHQQNVIQVAENSFHMLEYLAAVAQAKWHPAKRSERAGDLMVPLHKIQLAEDGTPAQAGG